MTATASASAVLGSSAVPIIVAIIQALKYAGLPTRFSPALALTLGLAAGISGAYLTGDQRIVNSQELVTALLLGLTWGLSASGLYEVGRTTLKAERTTSNPYGPPRLPKQVGQPLGPLPPKP